MKHVDGNAYLSLPLQGRVLELRVGRDHGIEVRRVSSSWKCLVPKTNVCLDLSPHMHVVQEGGVPQPSLVYFWQANLSSYLH
ncbi:hypothetical protein O3P69_017184 [Scylla paramamosain]|uniref:Uncharacterized protein n=1 Tax=Scylla paramamosain TaxID=85552 RepID=A0AAW0TUF2_SCYPA